jgi:hypothetical protein
MSGGQDERLQARVRESLPGGETLVAAIWVSRPDGQASAGMSRSEMSPWRLRRPQREVPGARRGVNGRPRSRAVELDGHIQTVSNPRVLARTDRRILLLAPGVGSWRDLLRPSEGPLRLRWECPRTDLSAATEQSGRLRLDFTDGSYVTLLTPAAQVRPFVEL